MDDTLNATSSASVLAVANRGVQWKEIISKSFTNGISSISTMKFDGQFTIKNGVPEGLKDVPNSPGVYVVYDGAGEVRYIGDAKDLQKRWYAGHLNENKTPERMAQNTKWRRSLKRVAPSNLWSWIQQKRRQRSRPTF